MLTIVMCLLQVVMGDRYSFAVSHEAPSMLYMFSGNLAILAWKSGNMLIKVRCLVQGLRGYVGILSGD